MSKIESAIYKTLVYQSIFSSLPTFESLARFLISDEIFNEKDIKDAINVLKNVEIATGLVCLKKEIAKIEEVLKKHEYSKLKINRAEKIARILKLIPWFKMIGVSGAVASYNAGKDDDIDFFVIISPNRIWLARLCDYFLLNLLRTRRNAKSRDFNNKICVNFYLTEDNLELKNQDVFTANEIARLIPLHGKEVYADFVRANKWISKYLANFWGGFKSNYTEKERRRKYRSFFVFDFLNSFLGNLQKRHMAVKISGEKVSENEIRFHPDDMREKVVREFGDRVKFLNSNLKNQNDKLKSKNYKSGSPISK